MFLCRKKKQTNPPQNHTLRGNLNVYLNSQFEYLKDSLGILVDSVFFFSFFGGIFGYLIEYFNIFFFIYLLNY